MCASPDVGLTSPVSILNIVVLPAPLTPSRPKHSPLWTPTEILSTARCRFADNLFVNDYSKQQRYSNFTALFRTTQVSQYQIQSKKDISSALTSQVLLIVLLHLLQLIEIFLFNCIFFWSPSTTFVLLLVHSILFQKENIPCISESWQSIGEWRETKMQEKSVSK